MSFFGRLANIFKGKANAALEAAEDATFETTLKQNVREMEKERDSLVRSVAEAMSNTNKLEADYNSQVRQAEEWHAKAKKALSLDKEDLAKAALRENVSPRGRGRRSGERVKDHETQDIVLKVVAVDIKIVPVVKWLNSFDGIYTIHSCQGNDKDLKEKPSLSPDGRCNNVVGRPYVLFYCDMTERLYDIIKTTNFHGDVIVEYFRGQLRYQLEFFGEFFLERFIKELPGKFRERNAE